VTRPGAGLSAIRVSVLHAVREASRSTSDMWPESEGPPFGAVPFYLLNVRATARMTVPDRAIFALEGARGRRYASPRMADSFALRLGRRLGKHGVNSGYVRLSTPEWGDTAEHTVAASPSAVTAVLEVLAAERLKDDERGQLGVSRAGTVVFVAGLCNRLAGMPDPPWRGVVDESARVGFTLAMIEQHQSETAAGSSSPRFVVARQRLRRSASDLADPRELTATLYAFDCGYWLARVETADVDSLLEAVPCRDD
jgi:hypothetical protein